ncbi:MAG: allantoinase AllB [Opitutaceae bacterium]
MFDTIIRNVQIVLDDTWKVVDLGLQDGCFSEIGTGLKGRGKLEFDGGGAFCLPGAVDLHVHFNEPGRTFWEGFETGSAAAVAGGITYLAEMPLNSIPSTIDVDSLNAKLAAIGRKSYADFGLWGGVVPGNAGELEALASAGVMGFKAFMSPSGNDDFANSGRSTLREAMKRIAPTGLRLALHAEDPSVLDRAAGNLSRKLSAYDWEASRPVESEISAVKIAIELSQETRCPITIVHVSSAEVLTVIQNAKRQGVDILCETCPHYLLLTRGDADRIGADAKCAPPLRSSDRVKALKHAVFDHLIDTIGSDHSPSPPDMKVGHSFFNAWGGIAGIQHGYQLLLSDFGVSDSRVAGLLQKLCSQTPAEVIQLKSKGSLQVSKDADFALIRSLSETRTITADSLLTRYDRSAYLGSALNLEIMGTWLRGQAVTSEGKLVGAPRGQFLAHSN